MAKIAAERSLEVNGFTSLGAFVLEFVANDENSSYTIGDYGKSFQFTSELLALTTSSEMGEIFKVMELTKNFESAKTGFLLSDKSHRLFVEM